VLSVFSIALTLLFAELVMRVFHLGPGDDFKHHVLFCEFDPVLGWAKKPGHTGRHVTDEYSVTETLNSNGLRGPEYPYEKPDGEYRVLVLGDSYAEGYTVEFEQTFAEVLKTRLNAAGKRAPSGGSFQVINAGTGGYSTDQELLFFDREGRKYSPDLVILQFCDNDIWYNAQGLYNRGAKPLFRLDANGKADLGDVLYPEKAQGPPPPAKKTSLAARAAGWFAARARVGRLLAQSLHTGKAELPDEMRVMTMNDDPEVREAWRITEALVLKLREEVVAEGAEFLVLWAPSWAAVQGMDFRPARGGRYRLSSDGGLDPAKPAADLEAVCRKHGIRFLDPTAEMRNVVEATRTDLYFRKDSHWNVEGHKVAGEILARECGERVQERAVA